MRNYFLFKGLISTVLGLSVLCPAAALASSEVTYTPSDTFILDPDSGNTNQNFGEVFVRSTSLTGWELQVQSEAGWALRHGDHPSTIPYILTVGNSQVGTLAGQNITALIDLAIFCQIAIVIECTIPIRANIAANNITGKPAGSYSDRLTFTLVEK